MDGDRFDRLSRIMVSGSTRRAILGVATVLGLSELFDAAAKKRKKRKKKKCKACGPCRACRKGKCQPLPDGTACGSSQVCEAGACVAACPDGSVDCDGTGCLDGECCVAADCGSGQICDNRQCATGAGTCAAQGFLYCQSDSRRCNSSQTCGCFTAPDGVRCGSLNAAQTLCIGCTTNAECASLGPGAFCSLDSGSSQPCLCVLGGICRAACPPA